MSPEVHHREPSHCSAANILLASNEKKKVIFMKKISLASPPPPPPYCQRTGTTIGIAGVHFMTLLGDSQEPEVALQTCGGG